MDWKTQNAGIRARKVHYPSNAIPSEPCRVPLGRSSFLFGSTQGAPAPQSCPVPPPWAVLAHPGTGTPSSLPPLTHLTQPESSRSPPAPIQHSLTTGTSSLTPASFCSVQGRTPRLLSTSSAVTSKGAQTGHQRSGIRNSVCRGGAGWQNQLHHSLHLKAH